MRIVFLGPQGSGKGTQAKIIAKKLGVPDISMGGLLRDAEGDIKKEIDERINQGLLVPPEVAVAALKQRLERPDCDEGYILDGFPRSDEQVRLSEGILEIDKAILIDISDEKAVERISSRLNCKKCGAIFNSATMPSKEEGICDHCGGELFIRDDDKPEAIKKRLEIYHNETEPTIEKYDVIRVNGKQGIESVSHDILDKFDS